MMSIKCLMLICIGILLITIYWPGRHACHYSFLTVEDIFKELVFAHTKDTHSNLKSCDYEDVIFNNGEIEIESIYQPKLFHRPEQGGVYIPKECNPFIKVAVIVPYRDRMEQLSTFVNYMHNFLQKQKLFYQIFIVNQTDSLPFNRAKMLNFGAKIAIDKKFPCLVLHDVDLLPLNTGNIYGCSKKPRHMSSSLDTFRFNLPYVRLFGGAVAITSEQFQRVNGMSNHYYGWGGEDDDFYRRLEIHNLLPYRFSPHISKYTMLVHKKERPNPERMEKLQKVNEMHRIDGLSSLTANYSFKLQDFYTLVLAS